MTTGHHTDDDFSFHEREIARQRGQNPDSLHKRAKLTVGEPTVSSVGRHTLDAILNTGVESASDAIGPSDWYLGTGHINFGPTPARTLELRTDQFGQPDLLYRPNTPFGIVDSLHLETQGKSSPQVGGTHYGDPKTDVYAFSMANNLDPMQFNIVKYVTRFRKKDGMKDLLKAKQTLERLIAHEESK